MIPTTKTNWTEWMTTLYQQTKVEQRTEQEYIEQLATLIEEQILTATKKITTPIGILFSGGVDSTLIAFILHKHKIPFTTICVGFHDIGQKAPEDINNARIIAKKIGFEYHETIHTLKEMENLFELTAKILGEKLANAVNMGVGSVEIAGIKALLKINPDIKTIFGGLGSEEIFAGYDRHAKAEDKHEECWEGLKSMFTRDIERDLAIANYFKINFVTPFLNEKIIKYAMSIPIEEKISTEEKKIILRKAAKYLGLEKEFANRPKRAAQYGARTDHALAKVAKKNGYKLKKEYIATLVKK